MGPMNEAYYQYVFLINNIQREQTRSRSQTPIERDGPPSILALMIAKK